MSLLLLLTAGGAASYTLVAETGVLVADGTAASLKYGRNVAAVSGSHAVTGTAATLKAGLKLACGGGAYALAGAAADLVYAPITGYTLTADAGAVSVAGSTASALRGYLVGAGAQAYAMTGQAAALKAGRATQAASGAVAMTGTAANATVARLLAASAGNHIIAGTAADLRPSNVRMGAEPANYLITGVAARAKLEVDMLIGAAITTQDKLDIADEVRAELAAELAKLAALTFTVAGVVDAGVKRVNDVAISGAGTTSAPWGPAP